MASSEGSVDVQRLQGWLVKEKSGKRFLGVSEVRRWFRVQEVQGFADDEVELALCYFKDSKTTEPRGWFFLKDVTEVRAESSDTFTVVHPSRTMRLRANSRASSQQWVSGLTALIGPAAAAESKVAVPTDTLSRAKSTPRPDETAPASSRLDEQQPRRRPPPAEAKYDEPRREAGARHDDARPHPDPGDMDRVAPRQAAEDWPPHADTSSGAAFKHDTPPRHRQAPFQGTSATSRLHVHIGAPVAERPVAHLNAQSPSSYHEESDEEEEPEAPAPARERGMKEEEPPVGEEEEEEEEEVTLHDPSASKDRSAVPRPRIGFEEASAAQSEVAEGGAKLETQPASPRLRAQQPPAEAVATKLVPRRLADEMLDDVLCGDSKDQEPAPRPQPGEESDSGDEAMDLIAKEKERLASRAAAASDTKDVCSEGGHGGAEAKGNKKSKGRSKGKRRLPPPTGPPPSSTGPTVAEDEDFLETDWDELPGTAEAKAATAASSAVTEDEDWVDEDWDRT